MEAISPTLPNDEARDVIKQSKDELLQNINRADRQIGIVEQNLKKLQAKQVRRWFKLVLNQTDRLLKLLTLCWAGELDNWTHPFFKQPPNQALVLLCLVLLE